MINVYRKIFSTKNHDDFPAGYIPSAFMNEHVKEGKVLIVGDYEGWGYDLLKSQGFDVKVLDVVDNNVIKKEDLIVQSIESETDFADNQFDSIVIFEVLEHLWLDVQAIRELRRILAVDGTLLVSVPFHHDDPEHHFRIHSEKTICRLLEYCGFTATYTQLRGLMITKYANNIAGLLSILLYPIFKTKSPSITNKICLKIHKALSKNSWINSKFDMFGIYIKAHKAETQYNADALQKNDFSLNK